MDSRLDSLFRTGFKPAEKTDTRQGIRREEQTDPDRKKEPHREEKEPAPFSDDPVLSLQSLHSVLTMLLQQGGENAPVTSPAPVPLSAPPALLPPEAQRASRAASAYQSTARSVSPGSNSVALDDTPQPPASGPAIVLSAAELRSIHALLHDVEILARQGVATITLRPAESFLQSVMESVKDALEQHKP